MNETTIAAISTPYGRGGIAVIRISGCDAIAVAEKMFWPGGGGDVRCLKANRTIWGHIIKDGEVIDDGMLTLFRAPCSFTGEDTAEISCHGGILITKQVLEAAFLSGAVQAGPGAFSRRAFCNGKLGLTQAEAIIDLIDAENTAQLRLAGSAARGALSNAIAAVEDQLRHAVSSTYAYIDYPDEDLTELTQGQLGEMLHEIADALQRLCDSYQTGRAIRQGIPCAIVGRPNTGKSSLLNRLLGEERAIVTDVPGTTRDVLEESVTIGNLMLRLSDTAGIRETGDMVEQLGVQRSVERLQTAELVLAVFDGSQLVNEEDLALIERLRTVSCPVLLLVNKSDLPRTLLLPEDCAFPSVCISARTGEGIEALTQKICDWFTAGDIDYNTTAIVANVRQYTALRQALDAVSAACAALDAGFTQDVAGLDMEKALAALGEVDGREITAEIVEDIFHHFCVGK